MNDMNWFEAFQHVNAEILATNDDELIGAWCIFLRSPFPHLQIPPAASGVPAGRVQRLAENFLDTAWEWRGKGVELLLFRLAQAMEGVLDLAAANGAAAPLRQWGNGGGQSGGVADFVEAWPLPVDEAHQVSYCDGCELALHPDGGCLACDGD